MTTLRFRRAWGRILLTNAALAVLAAAGSLVALHDAAAQGRAGADAVTEQILALPLERLEALALACSNASEVRLLSADEAAACSIAWETLRERRFGGSHEAILAWWRGARAARGEVAAR